MATLGPALEEDPGPLASIASHNLSGALPLRDGFVRELDEPVRVLVTATDLSRPTPFETGGGLVTRTAGPAGDELVWTGEVRVAGAHGVRLHLASLEAPAGTSAWVLGAGGQAVEVPLDGGLPAGGAWTGIVDGERAWLEVRVPTSALRASDAAFTLDRVVEGVRLDRRGRPAGHRRQPPGLRGGERLRPPGAAPAPQRRRLPGVGRAPLRRRAGQRPDPDLPPLRPAPGLLPAPGGHRRRVRDLRPPLHDQRLRRLGPGRLRSADGKPAGAGGGSAPGRLRAEPGGRLPGRHPRHLRPPVDLVPGHRGLPRPRAPPRPNACPRPCASPAPRRGARSSSCGSSGRARTASSGRCW